MHTHTHIDLLQSSLCREICTRGWILEVKFSPMILFQQSSWDRQFGHKKVSVFSFTILRDYSQLLWSRIMNGKMVLKWGKSLLYSHPSVFCLHHCVISLRGLQSPLELQPWNLLAGCLTKTCVLLTIYKRKSWVAFLIVDSLFPPSLFTSPIERKSIYPSSTVHSCTLPQCWDLSSTMGSININ